MTLNDTLSNALSKIMNAETKKKDSCNIFPSSKIIKEALNIMNENQYIGSSNILESGRGNSLQVNLIGKINKCGAIKPRFTVKKDDFEKFEKRYLPARDFGIIIVSTNQGIMTHNQAKSKKLGGRLLAYCY